MLWSSRWHLVLIVVLEQRSESSYSHQGLSLGTRSIHSKCNPNLFGTWGKTAKKKTEIPDHLWSETFLQHLRHAHQCAQEMATSKPTAADTTDGLGKKQLIWTPTKRHRWFNDHFSFSHYLYGHIINWHTIFHLWGGLVSTEGHITVNIHTSAAERRLCEGTAVGGNYYADYNLFYDTPLSIKQAIMKASPDRCFCCRCAHLHGTLIWLRGWRKRHQTPCGEGWRVESCSGDVPGETLNSGQVRLLLGG